MRSRRTAALLALAPVALLALGRGASGPARADERSTCPACGAGFTYDVTTTQNSGGGVNTDGCRYAVGSDGQLYVPELREVIACPSSRCRAAFFRAHLDPARHLPRIAVGAPADVGSAATLAPRSAVIARAIATYQAYGLSRFGIEDDPKEFEGKLWLRAAWAVREAIVREDDVRRLPFLFAPARAEDAGRDFGNVDRDYQLRLSSGGAPSPLDAALAGVDGAREALEPLEPHDPDTPSRSLLFGRAVASIDEVERTLLELRAGLREKSDVGGDMAPRELNLALARAAHREGSPSVRDRWLYVATAGRDVRESDRAAAAWLRELAGAEVAPLMNAHDCLAAAADRATGERRLELLVLAADADRRAGKTEDALKLLKDEVGGPDTGAAATRARALVTRLGEVR